MVASGTTNVTTVEASDSGSSNEQHRRQKRQRPEANAAVNVGSSRFKGVVGQQSGNWGAQIYANHQRIWLGTFRTEEDAAAAYDSAAIRLRCGDAHRNFPWTSITLQEPSFQAQFSTGEILKMIKDGSYVPKFSDHCKHLALTGQPVGISPRAGDEPGSVLRELFKKELTPSDVGKLNRLVIPKKHAVKFFPRTLEAAADGCGADDVELVFYDKAMRSWKFRYCYWKSSQSFVFTRGWNRFVKDKGIKPRDVVIFSVYEYKDNISGPETRSICVIDVEYTDHSDEGENNSDNGVEIKTGKGSVDKGDEEGREGVEMELRNKAAKPAGFMLFGVQII
ncbi:PREDICTED: AP2/ERF and B3 domain-containing transcription factor At1g51120-like [Ipomoea nil]|uniref:AP2/ERF and B3 domain-containing transcription factor At1g51120-like n=1 Tax=Ipomoea nil TaxID=35883 RepID=UPI00090188F1|nr:PREDICTED: AP2/ERF and B3 domain-containing transcription factor At1g51120-like [Ipomoea nil]